MSLCTFDERTCWKPCRCILLMWLAILMSIGAGCTIPFQRIDAQLALQAQSVIPTSTALASVQERNRRADEYYERYYDDETEGEQEEEEDRPSVIIAELLAIFPGLFVHGLGHNYAGDHVTARKIRSMGEWGYLLTGLGGGIGVGAYFLDKSSDNILPVSMYIAAGGVGGVGLGYFFTAWIFDIYDTPRAVRTGGQPWRFLQDQSGPFD